MASQDVLKLCQVSKTGIRVNGPQFNNMTIDRLTVKIVSKINLEHYFINVFSFFMEQFL